VVTPNNDKLNLSIAGNSTIDIENLKLAPSFLNENSLEARKFSLVDKPILKL